MSPPTLVAWLVLLAGLAAVGYQLRLAVGPGRRPPATSVLASPTPAASRPPGPERSSTPGPRPARSPEPSPGQTPAPAAASRPPERPQPADLLRHPSPPRPGRPAVSARLAIIIDDVGNDLEPLDRLARLPYPLTFAVLPHQRHSAPAAELLSDRGYQVILHLPMEPIGYPEKDPGAGAVLMRMGPEEVRQVVRRDLAAVPRILGVNNHMGSRLTSDPRLMRAVLATIAETPYFFIDSRTTSESVAHEVARELAIPSAERSVFLDERIDRQAIRARCRQAAELALSQGAAIAIGHPHPETIDVLLAELPRLTRRGVRLVFASELVR